jgi:cytochrome P450
VMHSTIMARKAEPRDDLISRLWASTIEGRPTELNDIEDYCVVLFLAGLDTVMNGMGLGIRHLAAHQDLQSEVRSNLALVPEVTEEMLRRYTFTVPPRMVAKDMEFDGVRMKKGEIAYLFLPAADLDPAKFPNPERFELTRQNKTHIAFGAGPHRCLGSHLARVELQLLYEEFLKRMPQFHLDPDRSLKWHGGTVIGPEKLWLCWDAQAHA